MTPLIFAKERERMTAEKRIELIRLIELIEQNKEYCNSLGIKTAFVLLDDSDDGYNISKNENYTFRYNEEELKNTY